MLDRAARVVWFCDYQLLLNVFGEESGCQARRGRKARPEAHPVLSFRTSRCAHRFVRRESGAWHT